MRRAEAEAVLSRDVARYFLGATRAHVVAATPTYGTGSPGANAKDGASRVFAAAAPLAFLEGVGKAVAEVGWALGSLSASHGIWVHAAAAAGEGGANGVVAVVGDGAHVFALEDGRPAAVRRVDVEDPDGVVKALGPGPGTVLVVASSPRLEGLRNAFSQRGWNAMRDPEGWGSAEETAAANAAPGGLEFLPPSVSEERRRARRRTALGMGIGAVVLLLASAGVHFWGAHRELRELQDRRKAIESEVAPALAARDSLQTFISRVHALEALQASAPLWTRSLVEVSALLPDDAYLTGFYASGDTVELEAAGTRAAKAIQTLRESGLFEDLRLQGTVERELNEGETVEERFSLRGRIPAGRNGGAR
jgi:Tfp pilus assembly protein PilN